MLTFQAFVVQNIRLKQQDEGEIMPTVTSVMVDLKKKGQ